MFSTIIIVFFGIVHLTVHINGQTCMNSVAYSQCSLNNDCGCLLYSLTNNMGVCGVVTASNCSQFVPCESSNYSCEQTGYVCLHHSRCNSLPICYPTSMLDQNLCPPIITSDYSSELTNIDGQYARPGGSGSAFYYEAIQIVVNKTGPYTIASLSGMDTHGFIYNGSFYPLSPSTNMIDRDDDSGGSSQFKLTHILEAGVPYTLVVSTHNPGTTGRFSIAATGPGNVQYMQINTLTTTTTSTTTSRPVITAYYSDALTLNNTNFTRPGQNSGAFYYKAIEVRVNTTGNYTFTSSSGGTDAYGYIYQGNFYPFYPTINIVKQDDDGAGGGQFSLTAALRSDITYIVVYTTYRERETTSFSINASGPGHISLNPINN